MFNSLFLTNLHAKVVASLPAGYSDTIKQLIRTTVEHCATHVENEGADELRALVAKVEPGVENVAAGILNSK